MDDKFFLEMVDKFNSSNIAELDFNDGNIRLILKKESAYNSIQASSENIIPVIANKETGTAQAPANQNMQSSSQAAGSVSGKHVSLAGEKIKSPIVGTFYSTPSPDAPPFVKPGTKVKTGQTLCILEAMKMMNNLEAEFDCEIIEVHVTSGELVEFGQELFTVKKN